MNPATAVTGCLPGVSPFPSPFPGISQAERETETAAVAYHESALIRKWMVHPQVLGIGPFCNFFCFFISFSFSF
jgi:hypothetical protein